MDLFLRPKRLVWFLVPILLGTSHAFSQDLSMLSGKPDITGIKIKNQGKSLKDFLNQVEKHLHIQFNYNSNIVKNKTIVLDAASLEQDNLLDKLNTALKQQGLIVEKLGEGKYVINLYQAPRTRELPEKDNSKVETTEQESTVEITIKGKVTADDGQILPGATVVIKGTKEGTITDEEGLFSISVPDGATVIFSMIGYLAVEKTITDSSPLDIVLSSANLKLDEVVVVAYGSSTRRNTNSAVSTVNMQTVAQLPVQSINDAVAGRVPGVIVTASSGAPGAKSSISIRGGGTPLYVIDNIIRNENDFVNLNPNDIDSYSILKDAAATALYGALGGNGVVLVTTKKGKSGKININYSFNQILSQPTIYPDKVSSYVQLSEINKVYVNEGRQPLTPEGDLEKYRTQVDPINYPNTDWQKIGLKKFATEQRHDLSLSSGSKLLTYYGSLSYYNQGSNLKTDKNSNNRVTYRINTVSDFDKINLKVTTSLDGYVEHNIMPSVGYYGIFGHIQDKRASQLAYNEFGLPSNNTVDNPAVELDPKSGYSEATSRVFNGILGVEYSAHFLEGLKFRVNGNYNMWNSISKSWNILAPSYANNSTSPIFGNPPSLTSGRGEGTTLLLQGFVTYNQKFGQHSVDFTGGYEQAKDHSSALNASRVQYQLLFDQFVAGPTINMTNTGTEEERARAGFIGRLSYNYAGKYFVDGTLRYDGNDLFPKDKQFGTFYAVSGGYAISEEKFMDALREKHIIDFMKLRGSIGLTGTTQGINNSALPRFQYISGYSIDANSWVVDGKPVQGTSEPASLPSTNFSWYSIRSRNLGLELITLNNRLSASADYFYLRTTGFVTSDTRYAQPLGIGLPPINFKEGATRREGTEFNVSWNSRVRDFTYKIGVNYTYFNDLTERSPTEDEAALKNPYTRVSGNDGGALQTGYVSQGFYQNNGDLLNGSRRISSLNVSAGDLRYQDINGDGQIDASDQVRIGSNTFPRMNFGTTVDLGYKGIFFSGVVQGSGKRDRYIGTVVQNGNQNSRFLYEFQQDYWTPENTNALYPRAVTDPGVNGNNNYVSSDFWLIRSGYVRLKYLQLGYDFKYGILKTSRFQQFRVFVSGTNLLTSSKSQKYFIDPESDTNNYNYPIQRTFSVGVSAGF